MPLPKEQTCKGCSLTVQPGYPKCPRCKMPLPAFESPLSSATQRTGGQGGTALESDSNKLWIVAGVVLIAIVAFVVIRSMGSSSSQTLSTSTDQMDSGVEAEDIPITALNPTNPSAVGIEIEQEVRPAVDVQRKALSQLEETLKRARLWSTIRISETSDTTISIVSSACEDDAMKPTIQNATTALKAAEFTAIRCFAKHGALLFELSL